MELKKISVKVPWILGVYKPNYKLGLVKLDLGKETTRLIVYWLMILAIGTFFGGIFMVTYEFTPPLISTSAGAKMIYPGLNRETLAEFILAAAVFIVGAFGGWLAREAPRREEEAWTSYMYFGLLLFLIVSLILAVVFMSKVGLIR